jgi:hypothetical protein
MKTAIFATIANAGLAAVTFGLASPASAAPSDVGTAQDTVNSLQAQGFTVIVNKVGNAPLSQCRVSGGATGPDVLSVGQRGSRSHDGLHHHPRGADGLRPDCVLRSWLTADDASIGRGLLRPGNIDEAIVAVGH